MNFLKDFEDNKSQIRNFMKIRKSQNPEIFKNLKFWNLEISVLQKSFENYF